MQSSYVRFGLMIATSMAMMFLFTYLNSMSASHVWFSETRAYMTVLMGAGMAVVMLSFMRSHYKNAGANLGIFAGSALVFGVALWLVRSQTTVDDTSWMKAMIPHHSIAILTSERANIRDPRVRALADKIIEAQRREIAEMEQLIADLEESSL